MCRTCLGLDGEALEPLAPHNGGKPAACLESRLKRFRTGTREHEMMTVAAASLSNRQAADVAA